MRKGSLADVLFVSGKLLEAGQREAEASLRPAETESAALARDHLRADEGLERTGDGRRQGLGIDVYFGDHEGLADVRAALFLDDLHQLCLERAVRGGIGKLQDVGHPVVEAFWCPVEEHQRRVAGDKLEIGRVDPAARDGDPLGGDRHQHDLVRRGSRQRRG